MSQTLFIALLVGVVVIFVFLYRRKKKVENKMGDELNALIESDDWQGVCRILRKQLIVWGCVLLLVVGLLVVRFARGEHTSYAPIIVALFVAWRFFKLVRLYWISYQNMKFMNTEEYLPEQPSTEQPLFEGYIHGCKITPIDDRAVDIKQMWLDAYEEGKLKGFFPVLVDTDTCFYDSLDATASYDDEKFNEWKAEMLNRNYDNGQAYLRERFEKVKEEYRDYGDWQDEVVGTEDAVNPINDFDFADGGNIYLVEVPVKEPWQVFAYIPFGGWNECPDADEQMAVAKYWYEKYGAVAAHFSNDMIQYYVPKPVTDDTMSVAEEHMGYCEDAVLQGDNLTTLAATIKESTVWTFWWD